MFLGRHVVDAALRRGHEVATFTRGRTGTPSAGVRALHGDRDDPAALPAALGDWRPEIVVDTSGQTRAAADHAAAALGEVSGYAFVSSLNAYRDWPAASVHSEDHPTWDTDDDEYGPNKAYSERVLTARLGQRLLTARVGLIIGPHDPVGRLSWWLDRIAAGGPVVVPDRLDQPIALVDARDLAGWLVDVVSAHTGGPVTASGPAGMTTYGGLLEICREVTGGDADWVPVSAERLLAAGVEPWQHLPFWLPAELASSAWEVDTTRARSLGLPSRPLVDSVADVWTWLQSAPRPEPPAGRPRPGLPADLERLLLDA